MLIHHRPLYTAAALALLVPCTALAAHSEESAARPRRSAMTTLTLAQKAPSDRVQLFVRASDEARLRTAVAAAGGTIGTLAGDVATVSLPAAAVAELEAALGADTQLEIATRLTPRLDRSVTATRANLVHEGASPLPRAFTGADVLVGVIDAGLDLEHPAFRHADGSSRVVALWDQSLDAGSPPPGYDYGRYCGADELAADDCPHVADQSEHGTHVTGIAAGSIVEGVPYYGIAPDADIAFANYSTEGELSTSLCDAVAWIFSVAKERGQPAVINMSLGTHQGPHDGSSLADACLDNLVGPGQIVVAAAGNEGQGTLLPTPEGNVQAQVHASGQATPAMPSTVRFIPSFLAPQTLIEAYFDDGAQPELTVGVVDAEGMTHWGTPFSSVGETPPEYLDIDGVTLGPILMAGEMSASGAPAFGLLLLDENDDSAELGLPWIIRVSGEGQFDMFLDTTAAAGFVALDEPGAAAVDSATTIGYPAIASNVLAVASYVTRGQWSNETGDHTQVDFITGEPVVEGARSGFSSMGPSRDPMVTGLKPDIAAPGELIASALAHAHADTVDPTRVLPDGYALFEGTSMASPAAAGAIALMLEADPELTTAEIRTIWDETADLSDGAARGEAWGRGRLDALASVEAVAEIDIGGTGGLDDAGGTEEASDAEGTSTGGDTGTDGGNAAGDGDAGGCGSCQQGKGRPTIWLSLLCLGLIARRRGA
ncbi:MAG: S8 family serine peptidase [Myxococcota bacterium]